MKKRNAMMLEMISQHIYPVLFGPPEHYAQIYGSKEFPEIGGMVMFYRFRKGTIVVADILGLPTGDGRCDGRIFGFHVHAGGSCTGNDQDPFANAGSHYNPYDCEHPEHAGDMPNLFENRGKAWSAFFTERFLPEEIVGKTVIIHDMPDDYRTQPSGDSGMKIACGVIK